VVIVDGQRIAAKNWIIATGSSPVAPPVEDLKRSLSGPTKRFSPRGFCPHASSSSAGDRSAWRSRRHSDGWGRR
jgi:hypothetical protein